MKKKVGQVCALVLFLAVLVSLTACREKGALPEDEREDKIISFWNIGTEGADQEALQYAVDLFNKNTKSGYKVEVVAIQNDNYKDKLVVAMSSGECPDMYTSWSGGPMHAYIRAGFAQPLDELYEQYGLKEKYMEAALAQATYGGRLYAVPTYNVSLAGVFYNKEIFQKYDLQIPQTVSELEAVCDRLKAEGITPFALANEPKWTGSMYFQCLAARHSGLQPFRDAAEGSGSFEDACFLYAGHKIQEWVRKGYFPEGVNYLSEDDGQAKEMMYEESAAMLVGGSWYTGTFSLEDPEFYKKIGWFSFPAVDGSTADPRIQIGTIGDLFISFNCEGEKLKAAFECASYYAEAEARRKMVEVGKIPPAKEAEEMIGDELVRKVLDAATNAPDVQLWYDQYLPLEVAQAHLDTCQKLFDLSMTAEEVCARLEEAEEKYLSEQ